MILDNAELLSSAQSCFASGADVTSTNTIDTMPQFAANVAGNGDPGPGSPLAINIAIGTAVSGGTSLEFVLQTDTNTNFSTAMVEFPLSGAIPVASLTASSVWNYSLPLQGLKRYLRLVYRNVGANTTGTATAQMVKDAQTNLPSTAIPAPYTVG